MPPLFAQDADTPEKPAGPRDPRDVLGWWESLVRDLYAALPDIVAGLLMILAFWILATVCRYLVRKLTIARGVDLTLVRLLGKTTYLTLLILGLVIGLGTMGIDVTAAVAGLGLTGFALGFALKDIVSNVVAGVMIVLYKPFDEGDDVKVAGFEGRVKRIDLRYTFLESEGDDIFVPNSKLFTDPIVVRGGTSSADMRPEKAGV